MNEKLAEARRRYENVPVPAELSAQVNCSIQKSRRKRAGQRRRVRAACLVAGCCCAFLLTISLDPVTAQALEPIPILGGLIRVVTGQTYHAEDQSKVIDVNRPELVSDGEDAALAERINGEIEARIDALVAKAEQRAAETYQAWNETRTDGDEFFLPVNVTVDYEVKYSSGDLLSFVLYESEVRASSYTEVYVYNLDLASGRELTLRDLLGSEWKSIANQAVKIGIYQRSQIEGNVYYNMEEFGTEFESIRDDQPFYINEAGNPVLMFAKYEIAPGYMGEQEFEIELQSVEE